MSKKPRGFIVINEVILPIGLFCMMLGLGLSIAWEELILALRNTRALITALVSMLGVVPIIGFGIAHIFPLSSDLAVGMAILATCPGGIFSSYMTKLARANVALSVALTTIVSVLYAFTATFWAQMAIKLLAGRDEAIVISPLDTLVPLFCFVVLPVLVGIYLKQKNVGFAIRHAHWVRDLSALLLVSAYVIILYQSRSTLAEHIQSCFWAVLVFNVAALLIALISCIVARIKRRDAVAVLMEHTVRQEGTGVYVATVLLGRPIMAFPLLLNALIAQVAALLVVFISRRMNAAEERVKHPLSSSCI